MTNILEASNQYTWLKHTTSFEIKVTNSSIFFYLGNNSLTHMIKFMYKLLAINPIWISYLIQNECFKIQ